jgi:sugar phosphate permease
MRRLMPLLVAMYVVSFIDRVNITFAESGLERDLGLSATAFGLAAGIFFVGYVVFEVPSNLLLYRFGARVWLARIMITWGVLSAAGALAWDATSLIVLRFLLGFAEAGFFPGVIYLLTRWFPVHERGRATGVFLSGIAIASILGGPLSGALLELDGIAGLAGWQWMFIAEGLPAVALGFVALRMLPNRPSEASWLDAEAARALENAIEAESAERELSSLREAVRDSRVLRLGAVYFCLNFASYGVIFWLADIIERIGGLRPISVGLLAAIPFTLGAIGLLVLGRASDAAADKRRPVAIGLLLGAVGVALTALLHPAVAVAAVGLGAFGLLGAIPAFWVLPTALLEGRAAAGGIAMVNSIGQIGGLFGPVLVGVLKDSTGSLDAGLYVLTGSLLLGATLVMTTKLDRAAATAGG